MTFLRTVNLHKSFGNIKAVDGINFEVKKGEVFGLLGPNGAGKSTAISMISTLLPPTMGDILFEGKNILKEPKTIRQKLGVVPQDIALYHTLTGYENLGFWGNMYGLKGAYLKKRIDEVSEIIGLNGRLKDRVDKYSGGMKRRLNIGAALLHIPELLIMDEPTVGIDPQSRNHILDTVLELNRQGMTIIYTSHYMEEAEYLCSRICIMDQGKIIASGTRDELVELIKGETRLSLKLDKNAPNIIEVLKKIDGVAYVELIQDMIIITGENVDILLADIIAKVSEYGKHVVSIDVKKPDLETVFLRLTGKALRD
ncbi:daunorubicin/doxorubicin resistance ATP-binding protein DrrA [Oxobacter pfennigii]|uniref:Daunorubicin/doxorubicin resistance ATP-binding protein DrrA n=1 Tax=Oxobacter pfennigii TaxID=36849 RepID=A0A0P8W999_9CLOT|nr:ATP-binding cassette domain-containing protein [Oxobacter pfennigii]KPU44260.1 daunorubicin/doxorubicin resistance ATP-binding protein DrrA [Oxobacter pfennigii]